MSYPICCCSVYGVDVKVYFTSYDKLPNLFFHWNDNDSIVELLDNLIFFYHTLLRIINGLNQNNISMFWIEEKIVLWIPLTVAM